MSLRAVDTSGLSAPGADATRAIRVVRFSVQGADARDLVEAARATLARLDPDTTSWQVRIDVAAETTTSTGVILTWRGDVEAWR